MKKKRCTYVLAFLATIGLFAVATPTVSADDASQSTVVSQSTHGKAAVDDHSSARSGVANQNQPAVTVNKTVAQDTTEYLEHQSASSSDQAPARPAGNQIDQLKAEKSLGTTNQPRAPVKGEDASRNITSIKVINKDTPQAQAGEDIKLRIEFDDHAKNIHQGDYITVKWPSCANGYVKKPLPITINGKSGDISDGAMLEVKDDRAVITFTNPVVGTLKHVKGWAEFTVRTNNSSNSKQQFIVNGGDRSSVPIDVEPVVDPGPQQGETVFYDKRGDIMPGDTDHIRWFLCVNNNKKRVTGPVQIEDQVQEGHRLEPDSLAFYFDRGQSYAGKNAIKDLEKAYPDARIIADAEKNHLSITLPENLLSGKSLQIWYKTKIEDYNRQSFDNKSTIAYQEYGKERITKEAPNYTDRSVKNVNADGGASGDYNQLSIQVTKVWKDGNNQDGLRPTSITVELLANGKTSQTVTLYAANQWTVTVKNLPKYTNGKLINYTWREKDVLKGYTSNVDGNTITNTHIPATVKLTVNKIWKDNDNQDGLRPTSITAELLANGKVVDEKDLSSESGWTATWTNLPKYANGKPISYTWREKEVPEGYMVTYKGNTIINTHEPATITKQVTKQWQDGEDQDGLRPDTIKVELLANGEATGQTVTLNHANHWTDSLTGLAKCSKGQKITYTWREKDVKGYTAAYKGNTITNTHTPATIKLTVNKIWDDNNNQDGLRPASITAKLLANGKETGRIVTLNADNNWTRELPDLPAYANGKLIVYTWQENNVPAGYTATIDGNTITNVHTPATITKTVTKQWQDGDNQDGLRTTSVTAELLANGNPTGRKVILSAANHWTDSIENLAEKAQGNKITYTWREDNVPDGYQAVIKGDTIINTHVPTVTKATVTKVWADNNNQDGLRPSSVTAELLADGKATGQTVTLNAANNWTDSLTDLAENAKGKKITYTWREINTPAGYEVGYDGNTITNTHKPATITKKVTKQWQDSDNQDGLRTTSVTAELLADGEATGQIVTLNDLNNWTASLTDLAKYAHGNEIVYTWREVNEPAGYEARYDGDTIINKHTPATIDVAVKKVWDDNNNQDGLRPSSITAELLANGEVTGKTVILSAANDWTASLTSLPMYANGEKVTYTWQEVNVPAEYEAVIDGNTITNKHTPITITKTVTKQWDDGNNQDGLRPTSITAKLLANGEATGKTVILDAANNWTGEVANLPVYADGKLISYSWEEEKVPEGYTVVYNGDIITNTHIPATTELTIKKVWADNNNQDGLRTTSVIAELLADGELTGQTVILTAANNWTARLTDLAENAEGKQIVYTWQEVNVPAGYEVGYDGNTIINTHIPATTEVAVKKVWNDSNNQDGLRPSSVTVELLANGEITGQTVTLAAANNWTGKLTNLPLNAGGKAINYSWQEKDVPEGYSVAYNSDTIINTHIPATVNLAVKKVWDDEGNQDGLRTPSVTAELLADGKATGQTVTLNAANNWTGELFNLPVYAGGKQLGYTWRENDVPAGYAAIIDGNTITNVHTPATITKTVTKQWQDGDNQDGLRPTAIMVNLLANGAVTKTVELSALNNWTATIMDLAKFATGQLISYSWQEADVPTGYKAIVDGDMITNIHVPEVKTINVSKIWVDNNDQAGLRPASVTAQLLADGQVVAETQLNADNDWSASFENLPVYGKQGKKIAYTIVEANVPVNYQSTVINSDDDFTIMNAYIPPTNMEIVIPETPKVPEQPKKPKVPVTPKVPEQPVTPKVPETPKKPEEPVKPKTPETPEVPEQPKEPKVQVTPKVPEEPVAPKIPEEPQVPEQPTEPKVPVTPKVPEQPEEPEEPVKPEMPEMPKKSEEPVKPKEPKIPETPEVPEQPTELKVPVTPKVPEEPKVLVISKVPEEPKEPAQPVEPKKPATPEVPAQPVEPEQPVTPAHPGQSSALLQAAAPQQAGKSTAPATGKGVSLPQTGNHCSVELMLLGLLTLSLTFVILPKRR